VRLGGGRQSTNIEDRRGLGGGFPRMGGRGFGGGGFGRGAGGLGLGGLLILLAISYFLTGSPLGLLGGESEPVETSVSTSTPTDAEGEWISRVLGDTEDTWRRVFAENNRRYEDPTLVLFSGEVSSACGYAEAAVGPFYCPRDRKINIDLSFYRDLERRFGAPGDFARAYVLAHEVGHHVQNILGVLDAGRDWGMDRTQANARSVQTELQADCFAGVWGYYAKTRALLEPGDLEEGLTAAAAVGDDRIQSRTQGRVTPESWTHGSSAQRMEWFKRGFDTGSMSACDPNARR
jgi:predicted metalloprotease